MLPGPPQLPCVFLLCPAIKSLANDVLEKLTGTKYSRPSAQQHESLCMQTSPSSSLLWLKQWIQRPVHKICTDYEGPWVKITWNNVHFLTTWTSIEISLTPLKLLESRDGQKTRPKFVLCSSCLLERVVSGNVITWNLSAQYSALDCFPLGQMYVYIYTYTYTHICVYVYVSPDRLFLHVLREKAFLSTHSNLQVVWKSFYAVQIGPFK